MRKLDFNEYKICQMQASLFEESLAKANFSSPMFIRRYMKSEEAKMFSNKNYLMVSITTDEIINSLNQKYQATTKSPMYTAKEMYWIGYIYGGLCFIYDLSPNELYKLFPPKEIVKYYNIYHTFGIEEAAERMMENIGYEKPDYTKLGVKLLKRLNLLDKLKETIGKEVTVYIDRPIGTIHKDIKYKLNYGYIKDFVALDNEFQDAYVLGIDQPIKKFTGVVIAIIQRKNDDEDKLIVAPKNVNFTNQEINKAVNFQEKYFNHKLIR